MPESNKSFFNILASPLDEALKYLQERQIPYKISITKPVSNKFQLAGQLYCLNIVELDDGLVEVIAAYRQTGFVDSIRKEV